MAPRRSKFASPTLTLRITQEQHDHAIQSASGGCLIADAIRSQYPHLTKVSVDMATIRVSDRKEGVRYTYLTPPLAQHLLLSFDQGWPNPTDEVVIRRAVHISPITRTPSMLRRDAKVRADRISELEAKEAGEGLTKSEKAALTRMKNRPEPPPRPASLGEKEVKVHGRKKDGTTISGGRHLPHGQDHPNLLRGRDRHFGAKLADPGQAFREAVDAAVAEKLAKKDEKAEA